MYINVDYTWNVLIYIIHLTNIYKNQNAFFYALVMLYNAIPIQLYPYFYLSPSLTIFSHLHIYYYIDIATGVSIRHIELHVIV